VAQRVVENRQGDAKAKVSHWKTSFSEQPLPLASQQALSVRSTMYSTRYRQRMFAARIARSSSRKVRTNDNLMHRA
jgi:hypothetical protein